MLIKFLNLNTSIGNALFVIQLAVSPSGLEMQHIVEYGPYEDLNGISG